MYGFSIASRRRSHASAPLHKTRVAATYLVAQHPLRPKFPHRYLSVADSQPATHLHRASRFVRYTPFGTVYYYEIWNCPAKGKICEYFAVLFILFFVWNFVMLIIHERTLRHNLEMIKIGLVKYFLRQFMFICVQGI